MSYRIKISKKKSTLRIIDYFCLSFLNLHKYPSFHWINSLKDKHIYSKREKQTKDLYQEVGKDESGEGLTEENEIE